MNPEEIKNLSFRDLLDELLHYLEDKSYTQGTLVNYRRTLRKIEPFMIENDIDAYTPEIGMQYYATYLVKNELGAARQKAMFMAIQRLNAFYSGMDYQIQQIYGINLLPSNYEHALSMFATDWR